MILNSLVAAASFNPKSLQAPSAWVGHLSFAAWVTQEVSPKILVELGTHTGNSYFSFCQSIVEAGLSTKCYAVDTWQGDDHAGKYDNDIFAKVNAHHQEHYAEFSRLLRITFDDAVTYFSDGSIELLHIDGLHTYEAVRHDFETWLPKLAPGAIVMFHDTNVRERDFGVWKLWEELQTRYSGNLEFMHSHGLGVLQLNNAAEGKKIEWLQPDSLEKHKLAKYFAELGTRQLERFELSEVKNLSHKLHQTIDERDVQVSSLTQTIGARDVQVSSLSKAITEGDDQLKSLAQGMAARDVQVFSLTEAIGERDVQVARLTQAITARDDQLKSLTQGLAERDAQISSLTQAITARNGQVESFTQITAERDRHIAAMYASSSWRITGLARFISHQIKRIQRVTELTQPAIMRGGGLSNTIKKALRLYQREGISGVKRGFRYVAIVEQITPSTSSDAFDRNDYAEWIHRYDTLTDDSRAVMRARIDDFVNKPLISVVMPTYNAQAQWLVEAIDSVRNQIYPHWELCIADDASTDKSIRPLLERYAQEDTRIKLVFREKNGHISAASNSALALASGQWVALLDHDDLLTEHALFWVVDAINHNPEAGLIYSDEDKLDSTGRRIAPYFKCELNPELLLAQNMVCHLGVYRLDVLKALGGFRLGFEGAQDYDMVLRVVEQLSPKQITHIPRVLYHWRAISGSTALAAEEKSYATEAGRRAVAEHLKRRGLAADVYAAPEAPALNRVRFALPNPLPLVSVIIPTRDHVELLSGCIHSILKLTTYPAFEIVIVDNGSVEEVTAEFFSNLPANRVRIIRNDSPFNFSALNNHGAQVARGELLCLMNNDIEILTPDWLEEMVSFALQSEVGCVGARLWYPNGQLQHGGVVIGVGGVAGHSHKYALRGESGYFGRTVLHQRFSAVTAACMVVRRTIFEAVNGLDEGLAVAFNDVDFCLRVQAAGYRNVWTPYAEMIHHESVSRGHEDTPEKQARFAKEMRKMKDRWGEKLLIDPAYSPNLTLDCEDFSLAWPPRVALL